MDTSALRSPLLLDISRVLWRAKRRSPTGIDRVELAYAEHFIAAGNSRPAYAAVHLLGWVLALKPKGARRLITEIARRWSGEATLTRREALKSLARIYLTFLTAGWLVGPWLRRALRAGAGQPIFLVVSHHHVAHTFTIRRIRRTLGAKTACLIHDLLPLEYPEYFMPGWESRYRRLSTNVGQLFDAVITGSESTAASVRACLRAQPLRALARVTIRTAALGARAFPQSRLPGAAADERPYFVVLGTIEPRKNHLLLLNLWARLGASLPQPPRLVVIGIRGWENEQVVDMLERSNRLRGLVEEHPWLTDTEVGAWLHGARALLLPSFAEGFGLPLVEALASGVPVICSDIPVFREVGGNVPEYLDPLYLRTWSDMVLDYAQPDSGRRAAQLARLDRWRMPSWSSHFAVVERLLGEMDGPVPAIPSHTPAIPQLAAGQLE
jgi:glycosyltransferase involved in cell wall biosynthesis